MKKLFICVMTSLCSTFAFADADLVVKPATISGGNGTMEVVINKANTTAFQFDVALPAGVSATGFSLAGAPATRKFEKALYNAETNTYRFLTYDEGNAALDAAATFNIALAATDAATTGEAETENILLVDPEGNGSDVNGGSISVAVEDGISISVGSTGKTTFVCDADLDFTGSEARAYVVTGMESTSLWLVRVYQVPAGTPVVVKANEGTYTINKTTLGNVYYKNFLVGNNSEEGLDVTPEGDDKYFFLGTKGFTPFTSKRTIGKHKAYIRVAALPAPKEGSNLSLSISDAKRTSLCADVDLYFKDQTDLTAYVVMGYDGLPWLVPVDYVSAGTPIYIKGAQGNYTITSAAAQVTLANMLVGNNSDASITIPSEDDTYKNFFVGSKGFTPFTGSRSIGSHKSYLQIPKIYYKTPASTRGDDGYVLGEKEVEVITRSIVGDDDVTGIHAIDEIQSDDVWYNLNGQRIDAPAKKGLYIKNGKKVIVK